MISCCIFDLDGVIVDTAFYHYQAWAALARELGFEFSELAAEPTKGVSRMSSLEIMLAAGGLSQSFSQVEKLRMAEQKNADYLCRIAQMSPKDILPGVREFLVDARQNGVKIALGSSSKNARMILDKCQIMEFFDAIADGTNTTNAKPDPEIFLLGAKLLGCHSNQCIVFEDAATGIEAAMRAGMLSVGVGSGLALSHATVRIPNFEALSFAKLLNLLPPQ